jgi:LPXTG-site transpeptidase (sortase) family protein
MQWGSKGRTNRNQKSRLGIWAGIAMMSAGFLLLAAVGLYYGYGVYARSQLDTLNFAVEPASQSVLVSDRLAPETTSPEQPVAHSPSKPGAGLGMPAVPVRPQPDPAAPNTVGPPAQSASEEPELAAFPLSSYASIYPAVQIHPKYWNQPIWASGEPYHYSPNTGRTLPDGFQAVSPVEDAMPRGTLTSATHITIPAIGVDSDVEGLQIINLGDSRAYETPDNIVGHIPQSANPGELGNVWFFGHLESPIQGEGNVFHRLPDIPEMLRNGDDVYVTVENEAGQAFLYKASRTQVVHQDDLRMYTSDSATLTLVACVPRLVYDHRILVTADLVGVKGS